MRRSFRLVYPTATLPRQREKRLRSTVASVAVHIALISLLLWEPLAESANDAAAGGPGARGGGGGGGAGRVTYIQMPAYQPPRSEVTFRVERPDPQHAVPEIQPRIVVRPNVARSDRLRDRQVAAQVIGAGEGTGGGPGQGTGTGGGIGSGQGTGVGSDRGPGTGGGGGDFFPPSPRNMTLPPLPKPDEVEGTYEVHFWVSETGSVIRVTVTPRIGDADYRERMIRMLYEYTFNPATTRDGTPIPGEVAMQITL